VGQALDEEGGLTPSARHAARLADAIREQTDVPVEMWDESYSTQAARVARIAMGVSRKKRSGHMDEIAAVVILQSYLDAHRD
jgi:putative Holliday junction resolvase